MPIDPLAHERISALEEEQGNLRETVARIDQNVSSIVEKIDGFNETLTKHAAEDKITATKVDKIGDQLERKKNRRETMMKGFWSVLLLLVGAAAKFAFDWLSKH